MIKNKTCGKEANWSQRVYAFLNHYEISNDTYCLPIVWRRLVSSFPYHQSNKQLYCMDSQSNDWRTISVFNKLHKHLMNLRLCWPVLSHSVVPDSLQPHGLQPARLLCPWGFSRQEHWRELSCPPLGDLPDPGIEPCITGGFFTIWATREVNRKLKPKFILCYNYLQNNNQQFVYREEICHRGLKILLCVRLLSSSPESTFTHCDLISSPEKM